MTIGPESKRRTVILVVDDEPMIVETFARCFRKDFVVKVALSGAEALEVLSCEYVDLVVTDYTMPDMNGIELLEAVAAQWPNVQRLIMSGHTNLPELDDAQRMGIAAELIPKPWRRPELVLMIERLQSTRALRAPPAPD